MNAFTSLKEKSVEAALTGILDDYIRNFGSIRRLNIDSSAKTIEIELELKGEATPIRIQARDYEVIRGENQTWISVKSFASSREWLSAALNEHVAGRKFKVPAAAGLAL